MTSMYKTMFKIYPSHNATILALHQQIHASLVNNDAEAICFLDSHGPANIWVGVEYMVAIELRGKLDQLHLKLRER